MASPETVIELPVESLLPSEHNQRSKLRGLEELAQSIKQHGVLEPLLVTRNGQNSHHIVAGHRRLAAAKLAGKKTVPCIVRQYEEQGLLMAMLVDNLQRDDLAPLEEARGYQQLAALHQSQRQIARLVGRSQPHVNKRLQLLKLTPAGLAEFEAGKLPVDEAAALAQLPAERQDRLLKETRWGSIAQRIRELEWNDAEKKRREAEAKKPKPKAAPAKSRKAATMDRKKESEARERERQLRQEAAAARAKVIPRLLSRGDRELQYAAAVICDAADFGLAWEGALPLLKLKKSTHVPQALFAHAAKSKKSAIDTILALAIATAEDALNDQYGNLSGDITKLHIGRLQKVGYKPTPHDVALLKGRR